MRIITMAIAATFALGVAAAAPVAAQSDPYHQGNPNDRYQGDPNRRGDQGPDRRDNSMGGDRRDNGQDSRDREANGRDQGWRDRSDGYHRDWRDHGHRDWRARQVCRTVWRHHHRQRVCYRR